MTDYEVTHLSKYNPDKRKFKTKEQEKEESQDDLWDEVDTILFRRSAYELANKIKELKSKYHITRKHL